MEQIFSWISKIQHRLFGSKSLLPYEQLCLDVWRASLSEKHKVILDAQLALVSFIQHQAGGAKTCFFYIEEKNELPLFNNQLPDQHVADIFLISSSDPSKRKMKVKIFVHRGRLFSIEFPKRPDRYMDLHGIDKNQLKVESVVIKQGLD